MIGDRPIDEPLGESSSHLTTSPPAPGTVPESTLDRLYNALGSPDPHLREEIAAGTLSQLIVVERALSPAQLRSLHGRACSDSGALHRIGESGTDSVFGRSFSILLLAFIHAEDNRSQFLSGAEWEVGLETMIRYGESERDVRAQIPGCGWAHAIAHASDLADELARSARCSRPAGRRILSALRELVGRAEEPFGGEEEDRVGLALAALINQRLISVEDVAREVPTTETEPGAAARANWKAIARALYFRLEDDTARQEAHALQATLTVV